MTPEQFVFLNFLLLLGFAGLFFWSLKGSKSSSSSQFKLTPPSSKEDYQLQSQQFYHSPASRRPSAANETLGELQSERLKEINPMFIYNGHSWDAYEVLGILPGSSIETVREAFDKAIRKSEPESHEFFKAALFTILSGLKEQGYFE